MYCQASRAMKHMVSVEHTRAGYISPVDWAGVCRVQSQGAGEWGKGRWWGGGGGVAPHPISTTFAYFARNVMLNVVNRVRGGGGAGWGVWVCGCGGVRGGARVRGCGGCGAGGGVRGAG